MAKSAFRQALEEAIEQRHSAVHPWSEAWTSGQARPPPAGRMGEAALSTMSATSRNGWPRSTPPARTRTCSTSCWRTSPRRKASSACMARAPVRHSDLLLEFAETCGMPRDEILNAQINGELLAETLGLQSWCAVQSRKPFVEALSGLLIGLESQVPQDLQQDHAAAARRSTASRGGSDLLLDPHRGRRSSTARRASRSSRSTPRPTSSAQTCVRLVKEATMMRRLYLDGVYRKFIAEAEGKKLAA